MYELSGVTKNYRKGRATVAALAGVDLRIEDGEWLAIQGPTGHGKTTLLQILGGLDRPTSGVVGFNGQDLAALRESQVNQVRAGSIGSIFQTFNLIPTLTAQENVETALVPLGVGASERRSSAAQALADVGLSDRARHLPSELSVGQQQRVAIARALVKEAHGGAGRRADREPRREHQGRDHQLAGRHVAFPRAHLGPGYPRQHDRGPGAADRPDAQRPAGHQAGHQARRQLTEPGPVVGPLPARAGHGRPRPCLTDRRRSAADHGRPAAWPLRYAAAGPE
jgi:ABC-type lipoprotein export system ATPase subunit